MPVRDVGGWLARGDRNPPGRGLVVTAVLVRNGGRIFVAVANLMLPDGTRLAEARRPFPGRD